MPAAEFSAAATDTALTKETALLAVLAPLGRALVAFSAGVDSTYLLAIAHDVLGDRVQAVTADSPSLTRAALAEAEAFCRSRGIRFRAVATGEFADEAYLANDGQRCYHCKAALMRAMRALAVVDEKGDAVLLLGAIADDLHDHRPGMRAAAEAGARWPLIEVGFTKAEVRERSRALGLPTWNRPAQPCLASRVPYGEPVEPTGLAMIEAAESLLRSLSFPECRARHHQVGGGRGRLCRIEVPEADLARLLAHRTELLAGLRGLGYSNVCMDLAGLQSGGFNALIGQ